MSGAGATVSFSPTSLANGLGASGFPVLWGVVAALPQRVRSTGVGVRSEQQTCFGHTPLPVPSVGSVAVPFRNRTPASIALLSAGQAKDVRPRLCPPPVAVQGTGWTRWNLLPQGGCCRVWVRLSEGQCVFGQPATQCLNIWHALLF